MKRRQGFVSNSSSSSFVVFGTAHERSKLSDDDIEQMYEKYELILHGCEDGVCDSLVVTADKIIIDTDGYDDVESGEYTITENDVGKTVFYGTRMC